MSPDLARRQGSIFLTAVVVVMIVLGLVGAFLYPSMLRFRGALRHVEATRAFFMAEAGLSGAIDDLNRHSDGNVGTAGDPIAFENGSYFASATDCGDDTYTVAATGQLSGIRVTIDAVLKRRRVSIWDNALIGGPGQLGAVINGNATTHGGVLIFGEAADGSNPVGPGDVVAAFSGTGGVKDNYEDLDPGLAARIPPLSPFSPLRTEIRIKNGRIDLSGSATLGEAGDGIDGWYSNGDIGGNQGEVNLYSDNGGDRTFDLPADTTLPSVGEPYLDPVSGLVHPTYAAYATAVGLDLALHFGATDPIVLTGATPAFELTDGPTWEASANRVRWDPATATLELDGVVHTASGLVLGAKNETIEYRGRGTLFSAGPAVEVHANLLPVDTFATGSVLGILSAGDLEVGTGPGDAQLQMAALLFAEGVFRTKKQTQIAGTILASRFDMGANVPQLFAVPALKDHLPPGWFVYDRYPASVYVISWRLTPVP